MTRKKIIAGGGDSFLEAVYNTQNRIEIRPSKEKCLFVIADRNFKSWFDKIYNEKSICVDCIKYILSNKF